MIKNVAIIGTLLFCQNLFAQIVTSTTTPSQLATIIPGFSQLTTINNATVSINMTQPPADPNPVDGDTTKEYDKSLKLGDYVTTNFSVSQGNTLPQHWARFGH